MAPKQELGHLTQPEQIENGEFLDIVEQLADEGLWSEVEKEVTTSLMRKFGGLMLRSERHPQDIVTIHQASDTLFDETAEIHEQQIADPFELLAVQTEHRSQQLDTLQSTIPRISNLPRDATLSLTDREQLLLRGIVPWLLEQQRLTAPAEANFNESGQNISYVIFVTEGIKQINSLIPQEVSNDLLNRRHRIWHMVMTGMNINDNVFTAPHMHTYASDGNRTTMTQPTLLRSLRVANGLMKYLNDRAIDTNPLIPPEKKRAIKDACHIHIGIGTRSRPEQSGYQLMHEANTHAHIDNAVRYLQEHNLPSHLRKEPVPESPRQRLIYMFDLAEKIRDQLTAEFAATGHSEWIDTDTFGSRPLMSHKFFQLLRHHSQDSFLADHPQANPAWYDLASLYSIITTSPIMLKTYFLKDIDRQNERNSNFTRHVAAHLQALTRTIVRSDREFFQDNVDLVVYDHRYSDHTLTGEIEDEHAFHITAGLSASPQYLIAVDLEAVGAFQQREAAEHQLRMCADLEECRRQPAAISTEDMAERLLLQSMKLSEQTYDRLQQSLFTLLHAVKERVDPKDIHAIIRGDEMNLAIPANMSPEQCTAILTEIQQLPTPFRPRMSFLRHAPAEGLSQRERLIQYFRHWAELQGDGMQQARETNAVTCIE